MGKGWRQLLVPYLFTKACVVGFFVLFQALQTILKGASIEVGLFTNLACETLFGDGPVWFLLALLVAKLVLNFALQHERHALAIVLLAATAGYVWGNYVCLLLPLCIVPGLLASLFLYIGYTMRREGVMERIQVGGANLLALAAVATASSVTVNFAFAYVFPNRLFSVVTTTAMSVVVLLCCKWLEAHQSARLSARAAQLLAWLGRHSLVILCFHSIDMSLNFWKYLHIPSAAVVIALKVAILCALPPLVRRVPALRRVFSL